MANSLRHRQCCGFGSVSFGPPGSGSVIICTDPDPDLRVSYTPPWLPRHYSPSNKKWSSIYQLKKVRKTFISTVLRLLYEFLSLKTDVNVPSKSNSSLISKKRIFCWHHKNHRLKQQDPDPQPDPWYGSADLDPYQNVTDPKHWSQLIAADLCHRTKIIKEKQASFLSVGLIPSPILLLCYAERRKTKREVREVAIITEFADGGGGGGGNERL